MVIHKTIKIPLYPAMFTIVFFDNAKEAVKQCKLRDDDEEFIDSHMGAMISGSWNRERTRRIIVVFNISVKEITHGSIAHELYHATARILAVIGHEQDSNNNEPETYLIEWMANQVYDLIKQNREHLKMFQV